MPRARRLERERRGYTAVPVGLWGWLTGELSYMQALDAPDDGASGLDQLDVFLITGGGRELREFAERSPDVIESALQVYRKSHGAKASPPWLKELEGS